MTDYTPTRDYPKEHRIDLPNEEKKSFDINDKEQVAEIINLALKIIYKNYEIKLDDNKLFVSGQIIENMFENDFGEYLDDRSYREFVMDYIVKNFKRAQEGHEVICRGLRNGDLKKRVGWGEQIRGHNT